MLKTSFQLEFEGELQTKITNHPVKYNSLTNRSHRVETTGGGSREDGYGVGVFRYFFLKNYFLTKIDFMNENIGSTEQNTNRNINWNGFNQIVCEKHEFITVTQTTTQNAGGISTEIKKISWVQCRKCGKNFNNAQRL